MLKLDQWMVGSQALMYVSIMQLLFLRLNHKMWLTDSKEAEDQKLVRLSHKVLQAETIIVLIDN